MGAKKVRHAVYPVESSRDPLWTFHDLQAFLRMPKSTLMFHVAQGTIPSVKLGRHRRFIKDEVIKALRKLPA